MARMGRRQRFIFNAATVIVVAAMAAFGITVAHSNKIAGDQKHLLRQGDQVIVGVEVFVVMGMPTSNDRTIRVKNPDSYNTSRESWERVFYKTDVDPNRVTWTKCHPTEGKDLPRDSYCQVEVRYF